MQPLRLLFWLKWKLILRGYRRNTSLAVGAVLLLALFLPMGVLIAIACGWGFLNLASPNDAHLLRIVFLVVYLLWLLSPLLGYAMNDSYDITKLFVYPLTLRQILLGAICGSLLDLTTLIVLPTLVAAILGFTTGLFAGVVSVLAVGLFLFHTLSLSQTIILLSAGILRSRRFRDSLAVFFFVFWIIYYISTQMFARNAAHIDWKALFESPAWDLISYLPHGLAARAMEAASREAFGPALLSLGALAVLMAATLQVAAWILQKVYAGDNVGLKQAPARNGTGAEGRPAAVKSRPKTSEGLLSRRLPPVVQAMMDKERKYYFRDPYFRLQLSSLIYMTVVAIFIFVSPMSSQGAFTPGPWAVWGASSLILLSEMGLTCNLFGTEGGAISTLFMFPCDRRQILLGKNLTLFLALTLVNLVYTLILTLAARAFGEFPLVFLWTELVLAAMLAVGNLTSIYFPYRIVMRGWRVKQQSASRGCGYSVLYLLLLLGTGVILLPVLAAFLIPLLWVGAVWLALSLPLALLYVGGLYAVSLTLAVPLLLQREQQIGEKVSQED